MALHQTKIYIKLDLNIIVLHIFFIKTIAHWKNTLILTSDLWIWLPRGHLYHILKNNTIKVIKFITLRGQDI